MALGVEGVVNGGMGRQKTLRGSKPFRWLLLIPKADTGDDDRRREARFVAGGPPHAALYLKALRTRLYLRDDGPPSTSYAAVTTAG